MIRALPLIFVCACATDPSPGIFYSKKESRNLDCNRISQAEGHMLYPGKIPDLPPRGSYSNIDALICVGRITEPGDRANRDEAVLLTLGPTVQEVTRLATAHAPEQARWHVDAFYPNAGVAQKIAVAVRTDLAERGHSVTDRVPVLAAGDIAVLARLHAAKAYPLACARYFKEQVLGPADAFLGLMIVDARETDLHAGVCVDGAWTWLR